MAAFSQLLGRVGSPAAVVPALLAITACALGGEAPFPGGWSANSPRDELRPAFSYDPDAGHAQGSGSLVIKHDDREGLDGWLERWSPVEGGAYYRFRAYRRLTNVANPRRSALVRIRWRNEAGAMVSADIPERQARALGHVPTAEPEHPTDGPTDAQGWTTVECLCRAPSKAKYAVVELHLQWAPLGKAEWSEVALSTCEAPPPRKVKLASVHYQPSGKSARENCEEYAPLVATAAEQKADLVVLGETVPYVNVRKRPDEVAEPIPGPTTEYFGRLAAKHDTHIVLSLYERDRHLVYNTAVLLGPDGGLIGKYRKVCLPHGEVEKGVAPGSDYPVFETRFGKLGLMVCYDGFFPEVARELANRGAEVIAWPVWGCDPRLAKARANENRVYLVSSTFMQPQDGWMISAIFDRTGEPIAIAEEWGKVAIAEVDLAAPSIGPWNLGDFRSMIPRHRPIAQPEAPNASSAGASANPHGASAAPGK